MKSALVLALLLFCTTEITQAKEFPAQARLFAGLTSVSPTEVNTVTTAQGLQKIESSLQAGLEITYPLASYLSVGVRYSKRIISLDEDPSNATTDYYEKVDQDALLLLARVPLLKTDTIRGDFFVGAGGTNSTLKIKTSSQDGELTSSAGDGWANSPYAAAGLSVGFGYKQFFFIIEGGYEYNKVSSFKRSGTISSSIDTMDLSGSYVTVGLMFDGITASTR